MCLLYMLVAGLAVAAAEGVLEERTRRAEARAELARARAAHTAMPPPITYREAHERLHAAHRALLPHLPHQRPGGDQ